MQYEIETLDGINYYTTATGKNITMAFVMCGTVFIKVNRQPAKALNDIAKKTKAMKFLVSIMGV